MRSDFPLERIYRDVRVCQIYEGTSRRAEDHHPAGPGLTPERAMPVPLRCRAVLTATGVLADSETLTNGVLRDMLAERGWAMSLSDCMLQFVGKAVSDEAPLIEQKTGQPVTEDRLASFRSRRSTALQSQVTAIPDVAGCGRADPCRDAGRIACASAAPTASRWNDAGQAGPAASFEQRVFSGHDMPRSKPHPDVYLAAAAALAVHPGALRRGGGQPDRRACRRGCRRHGVRLRAGHSRTSMSRPCARPGAHHVFATTWPCCRACSDCKTCHN
jgi:phosphoglycolate phosphatase-like HAD superfamily hydrolase